MEVVYQRCAGIDIGKREVVVCLLAPGEGRTRRKKEIRSFSTTTGQLLEMATGPQEHGCEMVAMENTMRSGPPERFIHRPLRVRRPDAVAYVNEPAVDQHVPKLR